MADEIEEEVVPEKVKTPPAKEPETFSREYVTELRGENKNWRLKAQEEAKKREEAEAAATKAKEEADSKTTAAEKAANDRVIRAELKAAAIKAGMVDLDGLKLADLSTVKLGDDGEVEGADALMEAMKEAKPYLFGEAKSSSSTTKVPPKKETETKKATEMTPDEYKAAKEAALKAAR